jgi:hypothetical protein
MPIRRYVEKGVSRCRDACSVAWLTFRLSLRKTIRANAISNRIQLSSCARLRSQNAPDVGWFRTGNR